MHKGAKENERPYLCYVVLPSANALRVSSNSHGLARRINIVVFVISSQGKKSSRKTNCPLDRLELEKCLNAERTLRIVDFCLRFTFFLKPE